MERAALNIRAGLSVRLPKISGSGWKVTVVPRRLGAWPAGRTGPKGRPRENSCTWSALFRATSTRSESESALTTETPTPCRPPEVS